jgi:L-2-amino-thiazoline-4-carboxylic acid hydrolase
MTNDQAARTTLYNAIKDRGTAYLMVFRELANRYGQGEAISVMRSASRAHGEAIGASLACFAPRDFHGLAAGFAKSPDEITFAPDIRRLDDTCLEVKMMACPIKDAWVDAGCSDDEICTLLYCASALDEATIEAAGFNYEIELWAPGKSGCCLTTITEKQS